MRKISEQIRRFLSRAKPLIFESLIDKARPKQMDFMVPEIDKSAGESPIVSFELMHNVYRTELIAGSSIDFLWQQTIGAGFHTIMSKAEEEHRVKVQLQDNKIIQCNAKELVDIYNRSVDMLGMLRYSARDIWGMGNAFIYIPEKNIFYPRYLPITSIDKIYRGANRDWIPSQKYPVGYQFTSQYGGKTVPPDHMVHLLWNVINNEAFGTGILQRLCLKMPFGSGETRIEPYKIAGKLQQSMTDQFELFSGPNELWNFPGLGKKDLIEFDAKIKKLPKKGKRMVTNVKDATARPVVAERSRGFDSYVKYLDDVYVLATQTPVARFYSSGMFSEASIREIRRILQPMITGMQNFLKYSAEQLFWKPLLEGYGFEVEKAKVELVWETAKVFEPELMLRMLPFLIRMAENKSIKAPEFRRIMRDMVGLPLDSDDEVEIVTADARPSGFGLSARSAEAELAVKKTGAQENP